MLMSSMSTHAILNFIDLAGSEKASIHENFFRGTGGLPSNNEQFAADQQHLRMKEGQHINKSLFFLTQVIAMRATGKTGNEAHIPFRNSPLTKILKTSLGGNSRTAIILCITPSTKQIE